MLGFEFRLIREHIWVSPSVSMITSHLCPSLCFLMILQSQKVQSVKVIHFTMYLMTVVTKASFMILLIWVQIDDWKHIKWVDMFTNNPNVNGVSPNAIYTALINSQFAHLTTSMGLKKGLSGWQKVHGCVCTAAEVEGWKSMLVYSAGYRSSCSHCLYW